MRFHITSDPPTTGVSPVIVEAKSSKQAAQVVGRCQPGFSGVSAYPLLGDQWRGADPLGTFERFSMTNAHAKRQVLRVYRPRTGKARHTAT